MSLIKRLVIGTAFFLSLSAEVFGYENVNRGEDELSYWRCDISVVSDSEDTTVEDEDGDCVIDIVTYPQGEGSIIFTNTKPSKEYRGRREEYLRTFQAFSCNKSGCTLIELNQDVTIYQKFFEDMMH